jgi:PEP-CTERM motif
MNTVSGRLRRKAAVVGSLALVGGIGQLAPERAEAATTLTGVANIQGSNALTNSTYNTTNTTPGTQSFPYWISREHSSNSGSYEILPFIRVTTSGVTLPPGEFVSGAELGLYFTDSTYYGGSPTRSNYVDLWSVPDAFTAASVNMTTYNGTNNWTNGFQAGIHGFNRTGPAGSHLAQLWNSGAAPAGTPANQINNNVQEYKLFKGDDLDAYLTQQILAGQDSFFALTNSGDNGEALRWVASSDVSWGGFLDNRPYLTINTAIPEPATGVALLTLGGAALGRRRRRTEREGRDAAVDEGRRA